MADLTLCPRCGAEPITRAHDGVFYEFRPTGGSGHAIVGHDSFSLYCPNGHVWMIRTALAKPDDVTLPIQICPVPLADDF